MKTWMLWNTNKVLNVNLETTENIGVIKISNIKNYIYLLLEDHNLYYGEVDVDNNSVSCVKHTELHLKDIDSYGDHLYTIDSEGKIQKRNEHLEVIHEFTVYDDIKGCCHGCTDNKRKVTIEKLSVNKFGSLFISDTGQLWGSGYMPQLGIDCVIPKIVQFFEKRFAYSASVGHDFAVVIVSKPFDYFHDDTVRDSFLASSCSHYSFSSPISENSLSLSCPLGLKLLDLESTCSSKNGSSLSMEDLKKTDGEIFGDDGSLKSERNIIFRNTEAAKQFLTSKISWMSIAGEEYLTEYTEKPTRILKENVTNMASYVYEGVKSVGDKVAILSRHVSGSSDCNSTAGDNENYLSPPVGVNGCTYSPSQSTSEHDFADQGLCERVNQILNAGSKLINTEVWTWGNIVHGQLGNGDGSKRERPAKITKLLNVAACKLSAQSYHASVLTLDGRAFIWGRNDQHQVTSENSVDYSVPKLFVHCEDERTSDVVCGHLHTVILSNSFRVSYVGLNAPKPESLFSVSTDCVNDEARSSLAVFRQLLSTDNYTLLNVNKRPNFALVKFLTDEQKMLEEMLSVHHNVIKPLMKKSGTSPHSSLYEEFCESFMNLLYVTAVNVQSLLEFTNNLICDCDILMFKCVDEYISVYKSYLSLFNNVLCINGVTYISKILDLPEVLFKLRQHITKKEKNYEEQFVMSLLSIPYERLKHYIDFADCVENKLKLKWYNFVEKREQKFTEAQQTRDFWLSRGKSIDYLKTPARRLIRESQKCPLFLLHAGRFSSHWFVLLNDVFVHVYGSHTSVHDLTTIWVDLKEELCQMCLKMPEDNLVLYTNEPEEKIEWFHVLQNAIKLALKQHDVLQPPVIRNARYTFTKNAFYKDAKYDGRWHNGNMHGPGTVIWNNGKTYAGEFCFNQMSGYGRMEIPGTGVYEGEFKENLQNGLGVLNYFNNDVYKGYFKDGVPHGHGVLRKGSFNTSTASVYIGEWQSGSKSGYGVMDDIITGEKYLGNWSDNRKQGSGLIVTSDGAYYEGMFQQDVLTGNGLMILEDGTYYKGDFRGIGLLNGEGTLTLKSGHVIEGNFKGVWNDVLKISNGSFYKHAVVNESSPESFKKLCAEVDTKWKALFQYCYHMLGASNNGVEKSEITKKIWDNVAVYLSNSHQISVKRCKGDKNIENSLKNLDIIPAYGRENLDEMSYQELKQYLTNAFQSPIHPLGTLLNDLCAAYTATYGGMVAHPLLLSHAVSELHSIVRRLYEIVRLLFPALPVYGKDQLIRTDQNDDLISCQVLLYPIILPRIYSSLFILFTLKNKQQDLLYAKRLMEWNKHSDYTLLSFLSVNLKFLKIEADNAIRNHVFAEAIEALQQMKTTFSPTEKLLVIKETIQRMTPFAKEHLGKNYIWNMDDLFPLFLFVVIRARILELGSELDFMENFMEPGLENGELGIMFTTLKACYQQILQEKASIN